MGWGLYDSMLGRIYRLFHKKSGTTLYVGKTIKTLEERVSGHRKTPNGRMKHYIFANGIYSFGIELLEDNIPESELDEKETEWIQMLSPPYNVAKTDSVKRISKKKMYWGLHKVTINSKEFTLPTPKSNIEVKIR